MKKHYFFVTSILLLLLSVFAFSDNLFFDVKQKSNSDPKFIIHGLFCFAWFIFLVIQSGYIKNLHYKAHISLGIAAMLVAAGVVISSAYIFVVIYKGWDAMAFYVKANRFFMLSYAVLIWLAYQHRKKPALHKRFIFVATLYMLGPILDRVAGHLSIDSVDVFNSIIWNALFLTLFRYDWLTLKKYTGSAGQVLFGFIWYGVFRFTVNIIIQLNYPAFTNKFSNGNKKQTGCSQCYNTAENITNTF